MWKKGFLYRSSPKDYRINDFKTLLRYINELASHKLGYPVSLLTYLGLIDNTVLGIKQGTLANVLLNNVGDPFKDSETSLLEVKQHERKVISILEKYYGLEENQAKGYITTGGTEGNFAALWWSKRYLINRILNLLIEIDDETKTQIKEEQDLTVNLAKISKNDVAIRAEMLQKIIDLKNAISANKNRTQQLLTPTVFFTKDHTHYSVPKIAEILHLNIRPVQANEDGSMNLKDLQKELLLHFGAHPKSTVMIIANIGTTITGAIDDVPGIKKIIEAIPSNPIYTIHMDGALTGFVLPVLKPFGEVKDYFKSIGVNTLAVSAHKYPGLSQPCGILIAEKDFFEKAFEKGERNVEYVGNIQDVTISGSRSGLNVLMFYNALCSLKMDKDINYITKMVEHNIENAHYLYEKLCEMYGKENVYYPHHFNVMFPRPTPFMARKYQLMLSGDRATICVLPNVTKSLINEFLKDLQLDKEKVMEKSVIKTDYAIVTLKEQHVKEAINVFVKNFCDSEPITKHLNIHYHDYEPFARDVIQKAVKDGLSKVALDQQHKIVACAITEDLSDPFIPHLAHYPKLKPVVDLLNEVSKPFLTGKKFIKGKIAHVWISAVDANHRGEGISTQIAMACIETAARKGFDFAYAEFTNALSENVTHQFKVLKLFNKINYNDFIDATGNKPFRGLPGAAASYVATIRPGVNFDALPNCYEVVTSVSHST